MKNKEKNTDLAWSSVSSTVELTEKDFKKNEDEIWEEFFNSKIKEIRGTKCD